MRVGPKYVGPIHGRVLLASSAAALAGPSILLSLRSKSEMSAIHDLVAKVDPARFQQVFSAGVEDAQALIEVSRGFSFRAGGLLICCCIGKVEKTLQLRDRYFFGLLSLQTACNASIARGTGCVGFTAVYKKSDATKSVPMP